MNHFLREGSISPKQGSASPKYPVNEWKYEYTYDFNGNNTLYIVYDWNNQTNNWIGNFKYENTYDSNGNNTLRIWYEWVNSSNSWFHQMKYEYTYDFNGNNTLYTVYEWYSQTNSWVGNFKKEYSYNNLFKYNELLLSNSWKYGTFIFFNHQLTQIKDFDWSTSKNSWENIEQVLLFYSNQTYTGIETIDFNEQINIYPNPTSDFISIDFNQTNETISFFLFDINGRLVVTQNLSESNKVSVKSITNGIYLYKLVSDDEVKNGKIVIQH